MVIAVGALVVASDLAQVGGRARFGHGAFAHSGHGRSVVAEVFQGRIAHTLEVCLHVDLAEESSLLQVTVGDVTLGVVDAHQGILNVLREGVTPVVAVAVCVKEDAAHASFGSVSGPQQGSLLGH